MIHRVYDAEEAFFLNANWSKYDSLILRKMESEREKRYIILGNEMERPKRPWKK